MNRYLGTKTKILSDIRQTLISVGVASGKVCDVFSGSLAVSLFLKRQGYAVIANDINPLSFAFAQTYLIPNEIPQLDVPRLLRSIHASELSKVKARARSLLEAQRPLFEKGNIYGEFRSWSDFTSELESLSIILAFLDCGSKLSVPKLEKRSDIIDYYTKAGRKSYYRSIRGRSGKRNYFSARNANRIDFILSHIRHWWKEGQLSAQSKCTLISVLLDSMERCANTHGTYHDFPRNELEERAKYPYRTFFPNFLGLLYTKKKHLAGCEDTLNFIKKAPPHDVLYIDPPYNFRQYTAYYHLPNFVARYPDIKDLDSYLGTIQFVRGQNMTDNFTSPFSNRDRFLPSLYQLIREAKCQFIVLSYFDGVNHWNQFLEEDNSKGYRLITEFFCSPELFRPGSLKVIPVERTNYQSQNGHSAKKVTEFLFVAERQGAVSTSSERLQYAIA